MPLLPLLPKARVGLTGFPDFFTEREGLSLLTVGGRATPMTASLYAQGHAVMFVFEEEFNAISGPMSRCVSPAPIG